MNTMSNLTITFMYIFLFVFGSIVGSFLNVVILRTEKEKEIVREPSHCDHCGHKLRIWENIPIFSYVFLGGKCSQCKKKISIINPFSEILMGLLFMLVFYRFLQIPFYSASLFTLGGLSMIGNFLPLVLWLAYISVLVLISVFDIRNLIVLDSFLFAGFFVALIGEGSLLLVNKYQPIVFLEYYRNWLGGASFFFPQISGIWNNLLGLVIGFLVIQIIVWVSKGRAMGDGDPYIAGFIGFILGVPAVFAFLFFSFLIGGFVGTVLILTGKKKFKQYVAFGPYLALGGLMTFLWGEKLLQMYFNFILSI